MKIIKIIKKLLRNKDFLKARLSYAQEGEDLIIDDLLAGQKNGFYVDVGACDPIRFSNSKLFYDKGWKGINIEPTPNGIAKFYKKRPRDINIQCAIGNITQSRPFYVFEDPALNTFSEERAKNCQQAGYKLKEIINVKIDSLRNILSNHQGTIDFMTIDVEGLEMEVLNSHDWSKKPRIILIEIHDILEKILTNPLYIFLNEKGYQLVAKTTRTCFFKIN